MRRTFRLLLLAGVLGGGLYLYGGLPWSLVTSLNSPRAFMWVAIPIGIILFLVGCYKVGGRVLSAVARIPGGRLLQTGSALTLLALVAWGGWWLWHYWETGGVTPSTSTAMLPVLNWAIPVTMAGVALWLVGGALGPAGKLIVGAAGLCLLLAIGGGFYAWYLGEPLSRWSTIGSAPAPATFPCPDVSPYGLGQCRFNGAVRIAGDRQYRLGTYTFCFTASGAIVTAVSEGNVELLQAPGAADVRYRLVPSTFYEPDGPDGGKCPANWELYRAPEGAR